MTDLLVPAPWGQTSQAQGYSHQPLVARYPRGCIQALSARQARSVTDSECSHQRQCNPLEVLV